MKHEYQIVFSLGNTCYVAVHMIEKHIHLCSGPFDWYESKYSRGVELALQSKFKDFMIKEHLKYLGSGWYYPLGGVKNIETWHFTDAYYHIDSYHDFPKNTVKPNFTEYEVFQETVRRRVNRFLWCLDNLDTMLFIRSCTNRNHLVRLSAILKELRKGNSYYLFGIVMSDNMQDFTGIENTSVFKVVDNYTSWDFMNQISIKNPVNLEKMHSSI